MTRLTVEDKQLRRSAQRAVGKAVRQGDLTRAAVCSSCRIPGRFPPGYTFGHHHNGYEPVHWLDIVWLCWSCHNAAHERSG